MLLTEIKAPDIGDFAEVIFDSIGALELRKVDGKIHGKMLVIGGGIIGLEMVTVYSTLGTRVDVVEMLDALMQGIDRDLVKVWGKQNARRFDKIMLRTKTVAVEAKPDVIYVKFESADGSSEVSRRRGCRRLGAGSRSTGTPSAVGRGQCGARADHHRSPLPGPLRHCTGIDFRPSFNRRPQPHTQERSVSNTLRCCCFGAWVSGGGPWRKACCMY